MTTVLEDFVGDLMESDVSDAIAHPGDVMDSMTWVEKHPVDREKLDEFFSNTFAGVRYAIVRQMREVYADYHQYARDEVMAGRSDGEIADLLTWQLTGDRPDSMDRREPTPDEDLIADALGDILSDDVANWQAEGFGKAKVRRRRGVRPRISRRTRRSRGSGPGWWRQPKRHAAAARKGWRRRR